MVASIQRINPRSLRSPATISPPPIDGPRTRTAKGKGKGTGKGKGKGKGKETRPSYRITLTAAAGIAVRSKLLAVVIRVPGHRPILAQIHPHNSARESAQLIRELPFGWRASLHAVTVATEPPAKVKGGSDGKPSLPITPAICVRLSSNLDVWPDLAALVVSNANGGPTIDILSPAVNVKAAAQELNCYSDDATTRAVACPVAVLPND